MLRQNNQHTPARAAVLGHTAAAGPPLPVTLFKCKKNILTFKTLSHSPAEFAKILIRVSPYRTPGLCRLTVRVCA
jgi:hypothetical protein